MTFDETFKYFIRDARPERVVKVGDFPPPPTTPVILHGRGLVDALDALELAPRLACGSVVLIRNFPLDDYPAFHERMAKVDFRAWDKYGTEHCRTWIKEGNQ